ncbi:MgtC/SapB family protein [Paenibacillus aurantius]|uniref:MgtC/SapB family protein n=1 Tax=Paenibacillus aurantius TaxID=2918900 RepID=A0AA96RHC9_9BACL|nr:MgtC/SapB family protein [Paenibacillus aurantius]WNQ10979.1 MgtC/SapB family protein [Paenibacillus aurantius]
MDIELLVKLGLSAVLGLVIGLERELKSKPLGLKTSPVIAVISCLLTIISIRAAYTYPKSHDIIIQMDPLRLPAQVVSGIGFLGAGAILRRGNDRISGLTTAAMIWGAAGIGIAVGSGFYAAAAVTAALLIISVELVPFLLGKPLRGLRKEHVIKLTVRRSANVTEIMKTMEASEIQLSQTRIKDSKQDSFYMLELRTKVHPKVGITDLYHLLSGMDDVVGVEITN